MCTYHFLKTKKFVEWICGNGIAKIGGKIFFLLQLVCGNVIAEIEGKFCGNSIAENGRKKKIMAAEIWGGIKKKMLRPQYFHNKS